MANPFTPEQISQILEEFFKVVGTRQYIGARYVPIFGRKGEESIEWDNSAPYEPLTIVLYQGNSYTSRQYVPAGVEITNQEFWAITGNYNAQVEQYRKEVRDILPYDETPTEGSTKGVTSDGIKKAIAAETTRATSAEKKNADVIAANTTAINSNTAMLNATTQSPLKSLVDANTMANAEHTNMLAGTADSGLKAIIETNSEALKRDEHVVIFGDSYGVGVNSKANGTNGKSYIDYLKTFMPGWTITKFVNGGAGFFANGTANDTPELTGMNYNGFVSYAKSTMSEAARNAVGKVLFQGGYNDRHNNSDSVFYTTINNARSAFPNAKIYVIFTYNGGLQMDKDYLNVIEHYKNWGSNSGCCVGVTYNMPYVFNDSYDGMHPTEKQQNWLSKLMFNLLVFGYMRDYSAGEPSGWHINENHMLVIPPTGFTIPEYSASMQIEPPASYRKVNVLTFIPVIVPIHSNLDGHYNDFEVTYATINTDGSVKLANFKDGYLITGRKGYYIPIEVPIINYAG